MAVTADVKEEAQLCSALDTILRAVPGYMAAPRSAYLANASVYDRILIMATTSAVAARPATPSGFQAPNTFPPAFPPVRFDRRRVRKNSLVALQELALTIQNIFYTNCFRPV